MTVARSNGSSEYQAMQVQYRQRSSGGIQTLLNYTLAKSEDTASSDVDFSVRSDLVDAEADRGPSDYDVRHVFSGALTWELLAAGTRWGRALTDGWTVSALVRAQSAAPVNVTVSRDLGFGVFRFRPDLVPGEPLYLDDPSAAGGRRLNPAAFAAPAEPRQGTLQRNSVRGFPLRQLDLSLRREVRVGKARVQFTVDAFNALNTPYAELRQPSATAGIRRGDEVLPERRLRPFRVHGGCAARWPEPALSGGRSAILPVVDAGVFLNAAFTAQTNRGFPSNPCNPV